MEQITDIRGTLLEGCLWDKSEDLLYFIDIEEKRLYRYKPEDHSLDFIQVHDYIGCIVPTTHKTLVAALKDGLYEVYFEEKQIEKIMDSPLGHDLRFNDGKCDPYGNFWLGSMLIRQDLFEKKDQGSLYCIKNNQVIEAYPSYTIPNGLAWDEKQELFYHIDTPLRRVDAYKVVDESRLVERNLCLDLAGETGTPDGMCMDKEGNLWIAMWGGAKVVCYNPQTREKLQEISLPRNNVSCCTFGGKNENLLYVTTAVDGDQKGEVFVVETRTQGGPVYPYHFDN
jgi:sugar lactone lactonase YvrE